MDAILNRLVPDAQKVLPANMSHLDGKTYPWVEDRKRISFPTIELQKKHHDIVTAASLNWLSTEFQGHKSLSPVKEWKDMTDAHWDEIAFKKLLDFHEFQLRVAKNAGANFDLDKVIQLMRKNYAGWLTKIGFRDC